MITECTQCGRVLVPGTVKCLSCGALYLENAVKSPSEENAPKKEEDASSSPPEQSSESRACPDCNENVSQYLKHCPNCGRVFIKEKITPITDQTVSKPESSSPSPPPISQPEPAAPEEVPVVPIQPHSPPPDFLKAQEKMARLKEEVDTLKKSRDSLVSQVIQVVLKSIKGNNLLLRVLFIWTVLLTVLCGYLMYQIYQKPSGYVDRAIAKKFEEPNIQNALQKVAEQETKTVLLGKIQPNVNAFNKKVNNMRQHLDELDANVDSQYELVAKELALLEAKRKLSNLADRAQQGYRRPYDDLVEFTTKTESLELKKMAVQQINKIEGFFETTNRIYDTKVNYSDDQGVGYVDEQVPTRPLIEMMLYSPNWKIRAKAAFILRDRTEPGVPEALLLSVKKDPFLDVIQRALDSFESVTGYKRKELFNYEDVEKWWRTYRPSYEVPSDSEPSSSLI